MSVIVPGLEHAGLVVERIVPGPHPDQSAGGPVVSAAEVDHREPPGSDREVLVFPARVRPRCQVPGESGEFLLLKVHRGSEQVLAGWQATGNIHTGKANRITLTMKGSQLIAAVNGEVAASVRDSEIAAGGYALLAGPGTSVRFDNMLVRGYAP